MKLLLGAVLAAVSLTFATNSTTPQALPKIETPPASGPTQPPDSLDCTLTVGDTAFALTLHDSESARAFAERLPLTLDMEELNGNEKFYNLPDPLPTAAISPDSLRAGELMLYGDNCLVLFYESFRSNYRYTPLGTLESAEGLADALGNGSVTITLA